MKRILCQFRRVLRDQGGATALEFAIVASVFVIVSLGIVEFGRTLQVRNELAYAIDHGARVVLMDTKSSGSDVVKKIRENFHGYDPKKLEIPEPTESTVNGIKMLDVVARYPLEMFIPGFAGTLTVELQRSFPRS